MAEMTYAVHTRTCIYLLDEEGVCGWALPTGDAPPIGAERCIGAQFVACLDLSVDGGLVGDLRLGTCALFAREEGGRLVLLRTQPIEHVALRAEEPQVDEAGESLPKFTLDEAPRADPTATARLPGAGDVDAPTPTALLEIDSLPFLDAEDLMSVSVTEVTLTLPLFRGAPPPPAQPRPPAP